MAPAVLRWASLLSLANVGAVLAGGACHQKPKSSSSFSTIVTLPTYTPTTYQPPSSSNPPSSQTSKTQSTSVDVSTYTPTSYSTTQSSLNPSSISVSPTTLSTISTVISSSVSPSSEPTLGPLCIRPSRMSGSTAPTTGTLKAAVIFVDFPDATGAGQNISELYEYIRDGPADAFSTISFGKLSLQLNPALDRFYRMPANSDTYNYQRGFTAEDHRRYIQDAVDAVGTSFDFSGTNVLYVVPAKDVWAISFSPASRFTVTAADGTVIGNSVTFGWDLYYSWDHLLINHETGHTMGLPDLYPYAQGASTDAFVGGFDLMGLINGQSPDFFALSKWQLGWFEDNQVYCIDQPTASTRYTISPVETSSGKKILYIPVSQSLSIIAEVRSNLGLDSKACGTGVLFYEYHRFQETGQGPIRVIDSRPNSGGCSVSRSDGGELNDAP